MNNQTKCCKQSLQTTIFSKFGTPEKIIINGAKITDEIVKDFGGVDKWLIHLTATFNNFRIKAFIISRICGVVKLYIRLIY